VPRDTSLQALAHDAELLARAAHDWAICPDHVVFLGARAPLFDSLADVPAAPAMPAVIVRGVGVFVAQQDASRMQTAETMLCCFVDIMRRVPGDAGVATLAIDDVAELLNWEAEAYRRGMKH